MSLDSERIVGLYRRHAAAWDRLRSPGSLFERPWLDKFLALLAPGAAILDLGCGAGLPISGYLIGRAFPVMGVDSSEPLIDVWRRRFPGQQWAVADMRKLALGRRFDGILAWDSFFHLSPEDQRAMFPIFAEHARPGTVLMFTSGARHGEAIAEFEGEPLYHGSLDPVEYRARLDASGFVIVDHVAEDPACGEHTIWLAQQRSHAWNAGRGGHLPD